MIAEGMVYSQSRATNKISRKGGYDAKRTNGIVNLNITFPDAGTYNVHVVYVYNCTLGFSKGSAELIF
jgi:hypothetical protein